jgi:hypothetical protein
MLDSCCRRPQHTVQLLLDAVVSMHGVIAVLLNSILVLVSADLVLWCILELRCFPLTLVCKIVMYAVQCHVARTCHYVT